jgi:Ca2+-transporting ATPase
MERNWPTLSAAEAVRLADSAIDGLSAAEAAARLARDGRNELRSRPGRSRWAILAEQFRAPLVLVLMAAAVLAGAIGEVIDAAVILMIVGLNAAIGYSQEYRAERAMAALKQLAVPSVRVRRGGTVSIIPSHDLVVGDVVLLDAGSGVPADGRLLESVELRCAEAALTGESLPVEKTAAALSSTARVLGDLHNMVFLGTTVSYGRGVMLVTATGMASELGRIADMLQQQREETTPLQQRLAQLSRTLAWAALAIVVAIFGLGLLRGETLSTMFLTGVSLAVAAIPEGLAAVVTISLALGAQRMLRRNALIRKLAAVETLGSVTVICSDKTGTLTENRMTVTVIDVAGHRLTVERDVALSVETFSDEELLTLIGGAACNDATFGEDGSIIGDPTEAALLTAAARAGFDAAAVQRLLPRIAERPFDSERKRMTTVHRPTEAGPAALQRLLGNAGVVQFTKGAVDGLLQIASHCRVDGATVALDDTLQQRIHAAHDDLAANGTRVLGVAVRTAVDAADTGAALEAQLIFVGMLGMIDPARPEARAAVATCRTAGIRPIMITGDHPLTARAIAAELDIDAQQVVLGSEIAAADDARLQQIVRTCSVFARVDPEHKLRIVAALQANGEIVAMTGDGVNDAPALQRADIGVAMGITGTDVSKEAADMVLRDDNFATIISAVAEGRTIYANIRKFIRYLTATNASEIWVMLITPLLGMPLALLPIQILWINLVTDGLPALALSLEPAERDAMQRRPVAPNEHIFARGLGWFVVWSSILMAAAVVGIGWWYWQQGAAAWQTMIFLMLTMAQMANVLAIRLEYRPGWSRGSVGNPALFAAVGVTILLQLAVIFVPWLQPIFRTQALSSGDIAVAFGTAAVLYVLLEAGKLLQSRLQRTG